MLRSIICTILKDQGSFQLHATLPLFKKVDDAWEGPPWTISALMSAFRLLLDQTKYQFQIRLFLDALDEFDGPHLLICQFLQSLVSMSANQVMICFSSRTEETFKENFSHWPGFSIQEHTSKDIRNYCMGAMASSSTLASFAKALVPEVVERASGVFLWVRLVIKDLQLAARSGTRTVAELRKRLLGLPLDLDKYYEEIIRRVPPDCRWETYVLLDLIIRASEVPRWDGAPLLTYIWMAISVSSCHTYEQAQKVLLDLLASEDADDRTTNKLRSQEVLTWGGGLVEIFKDRHGEERVQVMHQTVYEFVTNLGFKEIVLGDLA